MSDKLHFLGLFLNDDGFITWYDEALIFLEYPRLNDEIVIKYHKIIDDIIHIEKQKYKVTEIIHKTKFDPYHPKSSYLCKIKKIQSSGEN